MIKAALELLFPKGCLCCRERVRTKCLFCPECLLAIDLIDPKERCRVCFAEREEGILCIHRKKDRRFVREGAIFQESFVTDSLLLDVPRHSKLFASYFTVQLYNLNWPLFSQIIAAKGWEKVARHLATFLGSSKDPKNLFIGERANLLEMHDRHLFSENYSLTLY
jgi:hypothetical protein